MINQTVRTGFFLLGFSDIRELQILHFLAFLSIYLATLMGNLLIILTIVQNRCLHSPMYFFLLNLSFIDTCLISATVPNSMANSLMDNTGISFSGCITQVFLVITFVGAELFFLTAMAYDRYVAICHPLQYASIMNRNACLEIAVASWVSGSVNGVVQTANTFQLHFCSSRIQQFFCDIPQLLIISCVDTTANEWLMMAGAFTVGLFCFTFILVSYGYIFSTVFRIQSAQGRQKAFSTCAPHLTVFCLFFSTAAFSYMRPKVLSSPPVDLLAAVLYAVLPPLMNPIIYSLRNKEIQVAMWKMSKKRFGFHVISWASFLP